MGKLEDLRVERVDGVDRPATGHSWVIVKSAGTDVNALAKSALEAISKEEGVALTGETVEALKALAAALDIELDFAKAEEQPAPEAEATDDADIEKDEATDEVEKDEKPLSRDDIAEIVAKTVQGLFEAEFGDVDEEVEKDEEEQVAPTTPLIAKSKQPRHQDGETVEKSDGRVSYDNLFNQ